MSEYGDDASVSGSLVVNEESSSESDFRVESDDNSHMLFVDAGNNRVGIGTDSPGATLEISGTLKITGLDEPALLVLDDQDASAQIGRAHIGYVGNSDFAAFAHQDQANATSYALAARANGQTDINTVSNLTFRFMSAVRMQMDSNGNFSVGSNYAPGTHKLAINGTGLFTDDLTVNGNVGIGTDDPDNTLHVQSAGTTHIKIQSEDGYEAALRLKAGTGGSTYIWTPGNTSDIRLYAGGADRLHVDNDGSVGIGTTDPDTSAILELSSSNKGVMLPRVTAAAKPDAASALNGLMIYEEDTHLLRIVANGEWKTVSFED